VIPRRVLRKSADLGLGYAADLGVPQDFAIVTPSPGRVALQAVGVCPRR
jgi:hypothetical protein